MYDYDTKKIYLNDSFTSYTFKEVPGAIITDICEDWISTGMHMELFEVQYAGTTVYVVLLDKNSRGSTLQYKNKKTAQNAYDKAYALDVGEMFSPFEESGENVESWEIFREEALSDYKKWKTVA